MAAHMRKIDALEVYAMSLHTPKEALEFSLRTAVKAWTCVIDGDPAFMWGVSRRSLLSSTGIPWLLSTPAIMRVSREFLRRCPAFLRKMQRCFPRLENYIHARNAVSLRWLAWLGFTVDRESVFRFHDEPFYRFWLEVVCAA
jgi:hypothetical protein